MKPVIKKQTHYNVLLMRDDKEARAFRLHSTTLRVLLATFLVLVAGGAAGIVGGVHFFQQYLLLARQQESQEKEMSHMRLQLERLVNLECLIVASNGSTAAAPLAKNEEVGISAPPNRLLDAAASASSENDQPKSEATTPAGASLASPIPEDAVQSGTAPGQSEQAGSQQEGASDSTPASAGQSAYKSLASEESPLRISGFSGRANGQQRVRISYELSTAPSDEQRTISGSARYVAIFSGGEKLPLALQDIDGTRFAIARMKPMQSAARLPQGHTSEGIEKIEVILELSDGSTYQDTFDFPQ